METDADAYIQKSIGAQGELLQKYGSEMNIFIEANYNDLQNWSAHKKITGMDKNAIKSDMIQNVELRESLLKMQTEKQFEAYTDRLLSVSTDAELRALNQWTGETYAIINRFERFGIAGDSIPMDAARNIENVLNKMLTTEDIIAKRGSGTKHIFQNMCGDWKSNITVLEGQIFTDKGYTSVSPIQGGGFGGVGVDKAEFIIKIPKGTHGAYISQESHYGQEKEFLLQKGYSYRIIKVGDKPNPYFEDESIIQIWCEVILDD